MFDVGLDPICRAHTCLWRGLKRPEHAVLRPGFDPNQIQEVHHDEKQTEHAANHHQTPWHLMRALVFFSHRSDFRVREHAEGDQSGGDAEADDPIEHVGHGEV